MRIVRSAVAATLAAMRGIHRLEEAAPTAELVPHDYLQALDCASIFKRIAPLEVDLGCGDGVYLAQLAASDPDRDFLGIERLFGRVRSACHKLAQRRLSNARVLRVETTHAVSELLPPGSIDVFHVMFPDPWPKRRHQNRRLINESFLESLHRALAPGGTVQIATDQADYFSAIRKAVASKSDLFQGSISDQPPLVTSTFEKRFRDAQLPIYRLVLRKLAGEV